MPGSLEGNTEVPGIPEECLPPLTSGMCLVTCQWGTRAVGTQGAANPTGQAQVCKNVQKISYAQHHPDSSWEQHILESSGLLLLMFCLSPAAWSLLILVSSLSYLCLFQAKSRRAKVGQTPSVNSPHGTADGQGLGALAAC